MLGSRFCLTTPRPEIFDVRVCCPRAAVWPTLSEVESTTMAPGNSLPGPSDPHGPHGLHHCPPCSGFSPAEKALPQQESSVRMHATQRTGFLECWCYWFISRFSPHGYPVAVVCLYRGLFLRDTGGPLGCLPVAFTANRASLNDWHFHVSSK